MKPKYSMIYLTTKCSSPAEMLYIAAETGYDCIDVRSISMGLPGEKKFDLANDKELFVQTERARKDTGISIDSIENARIFDGMSVKDYEHHLEAAARLGVRHVLSNIWSADRGYTEEKFGELCDLAARYDQRIELEFVTWSSVKDLKAAAVILRAVQRPNAGILVDTLHFHRSGVTLEELKEIPAEWLYCLHICDAPESIPTDADALAYTARDGRLYPGDGCINIREIANAAEWPVYGIEIPNNRQWEQLGIKEHAARALECTKKYLGEKL